MSRKCQISNKSSQRGNNVSHANNKRRKTWNVNLHKKRLFDSQSGQWVSVRISSRMLREIDKKGLGAVLRERNISISSLN